MQWYNEPPQWQADGSTITIASGAKTDFWRKTHLGFIRDSGHFYHETVTGDFTAEVKITGQYEILYDQAGLMARADETTWLKCGIEFVEGMQYVSAVVTRDYSDWSVLPLPKANPPASVWIRLKRMGGAIEVFFSLDGETFTMYRTTHLSEAAGLQVGVMCCAPERDEGGMRVTFENYQVKQG